MKTFTQVSQILDFAQEFHQQSENLFRQLREDADTYALQLLIEQMEHHERAMKVCLERYRKLAPVHLMETWVQFAPEESAETIIQKAHPGGTLTPEAIVTYSKELDAALSQTYAHLAEDAESEDVREMFDGLLEMMKYSEKKRSEDEQAIRDHLV